MAKRITSRDLEKAVEVIHELFAATTDLIPAEAAALQLTVEVLDYYADRGGVE